MPEKDAAQQGNGAVQPDNDTTAQVNDQGQNGETPQTWEEYLETLPGAIRQLYDDHTSGLRSALQSEREQRRELAGQLREATESLEEGSQAREALEAMSGQLEASERRAAFYEDAARPEIGCTNPRLAYLAAQEIDAWDRRGRVRWDDLKQQFPELFAKPKPPPANAGAGAGQQPKRGGMNEYIRQAAGRQ